MRWYRERKKRKRKPFNGEKVSSHPQPALSHNVWSTGADTTGYLAVFTWRTRCHAHYHAHTSITYATIAKGQGLYLVEAEIRTNRQSS